MDRDSSTERPAIPSRNAPIIVQKLDEEQLALCSSGDFWQLITARREEPTMSRAELESSLEQA